VKVDWNTVELEWDEAKSRLLKKTRGISFELVEELIRNGKVVDLKKHPNPGKYPDQWLIVLDVDGYPWVVPCEMRNNRLRLATTFPARKYKHLLRGEDESDS
jgi:uncharacterized DUF497 family protein